MLATAAAIAPVMAEMWLDLGFTLQAVGEKDEAKLALERAVALDPLPARAWLGLAIVSNELADKARAEAAFAAALARDPGLSEAAFGLGLIYFEQRRYERRRSGSAPLSPPAAATASCMSAWGSPCSSRRFRRRRRQLALQIASGGADVSLVRRYALTCYLDIAKSGDIEGAERAYLAAAGAHAEDLHAVAKSAFQMRAPTDIAKGRWGSPEPASPPKPTIRSSAISSARLRAKSSSARRQITSSPISTVSRTDSTSNSSTFSAIACRRN